MTVVANSSTWSQMLEANTNFSTSKQKSEGFFGNKKQHSEHKGARSFQKKKQKRYTINAVQSIPFSNEKSP